MAGKANLKLLAKIVIWQARAKGETLLAKIHKQHLPMALTLDHVNVIVQGNKGNKGSKLLTDVCVSFPPGKLTAIFGRSGAGKSTLLNVASMRSSPGLRVEGGLIADGRRVSSKLQLDNLANVVGFVPQKLDLIVDGNLTSAENILVQVLMRWDKTTAAHESELGHSKMDLVMDVLHLLGLLPHANTRAGDLSGGQLRRLAIAVEYIRPSPILFLDEPTSGQDAVTALEVVTLLKQLTVGDPQLGLYPKTVVMVIHQPRPEICDLVDNVVVMAAGGNLVFAGDPKEAIHTMEEHGMPKHGEKGHQGNTADAIMDAVASLSDEAVVQLRTDEAAAATKRTNAQLRTKQEQLLKQPKIFDMLDQDKSGRKVPLHLRLKALVLRRRWAISKLEIWVTFFILPFVVFFAGGMPNAIEGGAPEINEVLAQILLSCLQPVIALLGMILNDLVAFTRSFRWFQRSRLMNGREATIEVIFHHISLVALFQLPVTAFCVIAGFAEYWTLPMLVRVSALALMGTLFIVLVLVGVVYHGVSELDPLDKSVREASDLHFATICYTGLGVAFGGLMYRVDKIDPLFKMLSYTSSVYYTQTGIMAVVMDSLENYECPTSMTAAAYATCKAKTDVFSAAAASIVGPIHWIPTYALVILVVGSLLLCVWIALLFIRPFHRGSKLMHLTTTKRHLTRICPDPDDDALLARRPSAQTFDHLSASVNTGTPTTSKAQVVPAPNAVAASTPKKLAPIENAPISAGKYHQNR
jgi:ABC-type multidrug transport system ATPase subunit